MANNYFQFKQFAVQQDRCAMKVGTDASIFGAYIASKIQSGELLINNVLDIGAGTGLLSLLLAQKTDAMIDSVEIDEPAFQQAKENFYQSPFASRLTIYHADLLLFNPGKKYDLIISNPPFYKDDLRSDDIKKNVAKHGAALTLEQLLPVIIKLLSPNGSFTVLLPYHRTDLFIDMATGLGYCLKDQLLVQHSKEHPFFRSILLFTRDNQSVNRNELAIKNVEGKYTPEFTELLKDYYLYL